MKKILLLSALAATFATSNAEGFSDCFKLTYEGETISSGQTITVKDYYDEFVKENPEFAGMFDPQNLCKAEIYATNISATPLKLLFRAKKLSPSAEEAWPTTYGSLMMCYDYESGIGNCLLDSYAFDSTLPAVEAGKYLMIDAKQSNFTDLTPISFEVEFMAMDGGSTLGTANVVVNFTHEVDTTLSVAGIEADTHAEYFSIQGYKVDEPQAGQLYIERKGGKVSKRIF